MIKLLVLDVDGTLTNGQITYSNDTEDELKSFDVSDGLAIATWTKFMNKKVAIITGRKSKIVEKRASELKITHLYQNIKNKDEILEEILEKEGILLSEVAAIGDDLNDYKMLKKAGLSFTPANGSKYIKEIVNIKCKAYGGSGAVREMIEYIIKEDGIEEDFIKAWL